MAENNSSAPLLPCPFCGERTQINALGRRWWRMESGHRQDCLLSEVDHTVPQTDEQKQLLIDAWNTRAPQAVAAQAAPAAVAVPGLHLALKWCAGALQGIADEKATVRMTGSGEALTISEILDMADKALATPEPLATEDSSAGDLARHGMTPRDKATQDQIAAVMLQHGTPEQQLQALATCCNVSPESIKAMVAAAQEKVQAQCMHRIADARNPVVKSGYLCVDCGALFSAADHDAPQAEVQAEPVAWLRKTDITELTDSEPETNGWTPLYTAPQAQPADALDAELLKLARAMVKFQKERGSVLQVHIDDMADLLDELDAAMAAAQEGGRA
ncbi:Lar family restriction alleviation protein [Comamonas sp. JUb58]|uniref:Lar family restriction alleviation protein n=1 Tax=Comamonas sp. JUb58 TaxID=2485114 RepID=UPI001060B09D|nr:Lar family restriction alleviation protein [Comamonas sp. JUb58]TDS70449.1 hypothetical protein EDF71_13137 [Comamonas sp. JUb58]